MTIVAVSQRVDFISTHNEFRDSLDQRLISFLLSASFIPVPIPNCLFIQTRKETNPDLLINWLMNVSPSAIVLSGGNDIGLFSLRDKTEYLILDYAVEKRIPVLGICRGMQIMSRWAGTKLKRVEGHIRKRHKLKGIIKKEVNSYHAYSITECPKGFEILALSEDGEIEAIRHSSLPFEGWMWHPEREIKFSNDDIIRLKKLFK